MKDRIAWLFIAWSFFIGLVGGVAIGPALGLSAAALFMVIGTILYLVT